VQIKPLTKENHSFKAIYRIPYSEKALSELQQKVLPTYKKVFNQKCDFFIGRNPDYEGFKFWIDAIARQNNSSVEWLKMNASKHGADLTSMNENFIHVITSDKDIQAISYYKENKLTSSVENLKNSIKERTTLKYKIKKLFIKEEEPDLGYDENTPEHLRTLFQLIKLDKDNTQLFNEIFPNIIELKTVKELFTKMMSER
jgi:hypothetical protein